MIPGTKPVKEMSRPELVSEILRLVQEFQAIEVKETPTERAARGLCSRLEQQHAEYIVKRDAFLRQGLLGEEAQQKEVNAQFLAYIKEVHSDLLVKPLPEETKLLLKKLVREENPAVMEAIDSNDAARALYQQVLISEVPRPYRDPVASRISYLMETEASILKKRLARAPAAALERLRELVRRYRFFLYAEHLVAAAGEELERIKRELVRREETLAAAKKIQLDVENGADTSFDGTDIPEDISEGSELDVDKLYEIFGEPKADEVDDDFDNGEEQ